MCGVTLVCPLCSLIGFLSKRERIRQKILVVLQGRVELQGEADEF